MGLNEFLVISAGLIVGWVVASKIMSTYTRKSTDYDAAEWFEILDVPSDATFAQIDEAYDRKCRELKEQEPLVMTVSENEKASRNQTHLDDAYRFGKKRGSTDAKVDRP